MSRQNKTLKEVSGMSKPELKGLTYEQLISIPNDRLTPRESDWLEARLIAVRGAEETAKHRAALRGQKLEDALKRTREETRQDLESIRSAYRERGIRKRQADSAPLSAEAEAASGGRATRGRVTFGARAQRTGERPGKATIAGRPIDQRMLVRTYHMPVISRPPRAKPGRKSRQLRIITTTPKRMP